MRQVVVVHRESDPEAWAMLDGVPRQEPVSREETVWPVPQIGVAEQPSLDQLTKPGGAVLEASGAVVDVLGRLQPCHLPAGVIELQVLLFDDGGGLLARRRESGERAGSHEGRRASRHEGARRQRAEEATSGQHDGFDDLE